MLLGRSIRLIRVVFFIIINSLYDSFFLWQFLFLSFRALKVIFKFGQLAGMVLMLPASPSLMLSSCLLKIKIKLSFFILRK